LEAGERTQDQFLGRDCQETAWGPKAAWDKDRKVGEATSKDVEDILGKFHGTPGDLEQEVELVALQIFKLVFKSL
jgi:hypothetical protein